MTYAFYKDSSIVSDDLAGSVANAKLANSAVTIAGSSVSLGGSIAASTLAAAIDGESMALTAVTDLDVASAGTLSVFDTVTTLTLACSTGVIISGDLTVSGDTVTVNTSTLSVEDPLIILANGNSSSDAVDIGLYGLYDTSGTDKYSGLFRDANDSGKWKLFKDLQAAPTTTVNTSGTGYAKATLVADIEGDVTGDVTGNADTSTKIASITNSNIVQLTSTQTLTNKTLTSPTLTTPALGTPASGVLTNCSGTASSLTAGTASVATTVTITDNESTSETNAIIFTAGGALTGGNLGLESDGDLTYTPSSGTLAATVFSGNLTLDSVAVTAITTSAESFSDSDTTLMTAKAIADKIEAYGYGTGGGDISSVVVTADDSNTVGSASGAANFTLTGGTGIASSVTGTNTLSVAIDSTVATLSGTQTLTNKTLTAPTIGSSIDLPADSIDAITEIKSDLKSGSDATLITGTKGTSGYYATWNSDGDLVDGGAVPSGTIVGTSDSQTLTNKTLTSPTIATPAITRTITGAAGATITPSSTSSAQTNLGTAVVDGFVLVTAPGSSGTYLEKLPAVTSADDGKTMTLKFLSGFSSSKKVTISTTSSQTIDGASSVTVDQAYASITFLAEYTSSTGQWLIV